MPSLSMEGCESNMHLYTHACPCLDEAYKQHIPLLMRVTSVSAGGVGRRQVFFYSCNPCDALQYSIFFATLLKLTCQYFKIHVHEE